MRARFFAAGIHVLLSSLALGGLAVIVFGLWYPGTYREMSGGLHLFWVLLLVDIVLGPTVTLIIFNVQKPRDVLRRDLMIVGLVQVIAFSYGGWSLFQARPVHLVFEYDRFRVVTATEVVHEDGTVAARRRMPFTGPTVVACRPFVSQDERLNATITALAGVPVSTRSVFWQDYEMSRSSVLAASRSLGELKGRIPVDRRDLSEALRVAETSADNRRLSYLPLMARTSIWTVLIDGTTADVVAFLPFDPF